MAQTHRQDGTPAGETGIRRAGLTRREALARLAAGAGALGALAASPARPASAVPEPWPIGGPTTTRRAAGGTFTLVEGAEPEGLDPARHNGPFQHPLFAVYEGLLQLDAQMQIQPGLAAAWEASADASRWTFRLRDGVRFHDGTPCDAAAVKASLERLIDPATASSRRSNYTPLKQIEAVDPTTLRIAGDGPLVDLPYLLADTPALVVSPAAAAAGGEALARQPVGTGPYRFVNWLGGASLTLDRWDGYTPPANGARPAMDRLEFRWVREATVRAAMLRTGEADMSLNLSPEDTPALSGLADVAVVRQTLASAVAAEMRQTQPPFSDVRVRRAMNLAVDRAAIVDQILKGDGEVANTPGLPGLAGTIALDPYPFDPAEARRLLAEAGYGGFDSTIYYVSGRLAKDDQVVEAVQGYLAAVGIRLGIVKVEEANFFGILRRHPDEMVASMPLPLRSSSFLDNHLYRTYHSEQAIADGTSRSGYRNPDVDRVLDAERREADPTRRAAFFAEAQRLIWQDAPFLYLYNRIAVYGLRRDIEGVIPLPTGIVVTPGARRR